MKHVSGADNALIVGVLITAALGMFWMAVGYSGAVPREYRNTSPGFGWSWDFNYDQAMREAGTFGADPWPWKAVWDGKQLVLPLDQSLLYEGLEITYRGMEKSDHFRMEVVNHSLDSQYPYRHDIQLQGDKTAFVLGDRRFAVAKIDPRHIQIKPLF